MKPVTTTTTKTIKKAPFGVMKTFTFTLLATLPLIGLVLVRPASAQTGAAKDCNTISDPKERRTCWVNKARKGEKNLRGAFMPGAVLSGRDLRNVDLSGAKLAKALLDGAKLAGANLSKADLRGTYLNEADLTGANLSGANLSGAKLPKANLAGAILTGANLRDLTVEGLAGAPPANLTGMTEEDLTATNLSEANLSGADLNYATLFRANLNQAKLRQAILVATNLSEANLSGADLFGANLSEAKLIKVILVGANLSEAKLRQAILVGANLTGAKLIKANLTDANLTRADLTKATLTRADLTKATLTKADLRGADLTEAKLSGAILTDIKRDKDTKGLPTNAVPDQALKLPLKAGTVLNKGIKLTSPSGNHTLVVGQDGNLMVRNKDDVYVWGTNQVILNFGNPAAPGVDRVEFRSDGSLTSINEKGVVVWTAPVTRLDPKATLNVTDNGVLQLVAANGEILWASKK